MTSHDPARAWRSRLRGPGARHAYSLGVALVVLLASACAPPEIGPSAFVGPQPSPSPAAPGPTRWMPDAPSPQPSWLLPWSRQTTPSWLCPDAGWVG